MITVDRATKRYLQIAALEQTARSAEEAIGRVEKEIEEAEARRTELRRVKRDALEEMRKAALDEGQLPLFDDVTHALSVAPVGQQTGTARGQS